MPFQMLLMKLAFRGFPWLNHTNKTRAEERESIIYASLVPQDYGREKRGETGGGVGSDGERGGVTESEREREGAMDVRFSLSI